MLKIYGNQPPELLTNLNVGGVCPHCKTPGRFTLCTVANANLSKDQVREIIAGYTCDTCLRIVPIRWKVTGYGQQVNNTCAQPTVHDPEVVLPVSEPFEFAHVPAEVEKEIREALDCLSVNSYNAFAAMSRRAVQAMCTNLGANASTKVQAQIEEMATLTGLDDEWKKLAVQVMLVGHDGSHPHLPDVNADRAAVLLSLLADLTYQLYTRPGKVREAAALRRDAIGATKQQP